jgi:1,4-alpha-glucan branching enzyme
MEEIMALKKTAAKNGKMMTVSFSLTSEVVGAAKEVRIVGEFNDWNTADPKGKMSKKKDGTWSVNVSLEKGKNYQFRYLLDGKRWVNDPKADGYVHVSDVASDNSIVSV